MWKMLRIIHKILFQTYFSIPNIVEKLQGVILYTNLDIFFFFINTETFYSQL